MKRTLIKGSLLLVVALAVLLLGFAPNAGITTDPEISAIISNINSNNIFNTAQALQNFRTRQSCSDQPQAGQGVTSARDFLFSQYSAIPGLRVRLDPFVHPHCPTSPTYNVISWLPGIHHDRLVIIGGHYDSRTTNVFDNTSDAPGAMTPVPNQRWFWKLRVCSPDIALTPPLCSWRFLARSRDSSAQARSQPTSLVTSRIRRSSRC